MTSLLQARATYTRDAILAATPAQRVVMLYDRLVLDCRRGEAAQLQEHWQEAHRQLVHAQEIVTELQLSLRQDLWDGAERLLAVYVYVKNALVAANVNRDVERTRESIRLLEPLRDAWRQAAEQLEADATAQQGDLGVA